MFAKSPRVTTVVSVREPTDSVQGVDSFPPRNVEQARIYFIVRRVGISEARATILAALIFPEIPTRRTMK